MWKMSDITRGGHSCCFSRFPQNGTVIAPYPKFAKKRQNSLCPNVEKGGRDCYRSTAGIEPPSTCGLTARQQVEEKVGGEG